MLNIILYTCNSTHTTKTCFDMFIPSSGIICAKLKTSFSQQNNTILRTVVFSALYSRASIINVK